MIIHRPRPIGIVSLLLIALLVVPFALVGGLGAWVVAVAIWAGVSVLLVRRYIGRGKRDKPSPWVV